MTIVKTSGDTHFLKYLTSFFSSENIIIIKRSLNPDEISEDLLKNLALTYGVGNVKKIMNEYIRKRGGLFPVIIDDMALVQHFRLFTTKKVRLAMAISKEGIEVKNEEKSVKAHLFFLIVSPKKRPDLYLRIMSAIRSMLKDKNFTEDLINNTDKKAVWELVEQKNVVIPDYVVAGDIMVHPKIVINDTDNLESAIDLFVKTRWLCIPVVDKDGDLVGEVTIQELMNVCLPRYILWMDEISPVLNFESFMNLLYNEGHTWLDEIMIRDMAVIQMNDPAIKAGIEMTKLAANHAYVLNDKRLVGIIPIQQFIDKVLRE